MDSQTTPAIYRHRAVVRVSHWLNAVAIVVLILTGVEILAHHPELYWGETGFFGDPYFLSFGSEEHEFIGMGTGRSLHFIAAWVLVAASFVYLVWGFASGHVGKRLLPAGKDLAPKALAREISDHAAFRHVQHEADGYNVLQKLAYLSVIFVAAPLMLLTGLAMSPDVTAIVPWLIEIFGGRQTARSVHFIGAVTFLLFALVHVWQVWLVGFRRETRAMITGWRRPRHRSVVQPAQTEAKS